MKRLVLSKRIPAFVMVFVLGLLLASTWSLIHWPLATLHDEFSYLLAADTFANFRCTNTTPQRWQHFESFHVITHPTYCSKYPPALSTFLAMGQLLYDPAVGLWLAAGFAAVSMFYAARAVSSYRNSFLVALILIANPAAHAYWSVKFMPGWPAIGFAALVLGGVLRLYIEPRSSLSALFTGIGIAGLALTRPFEGFVFVAVTALVAAGLWNGRRIKSSAEGSTKLQGLLSRRATLILAGILFAGGVLIAFYNMQTTGRATRFAYQLHEEQYGLAPLLLFLKPPSDVPLYNHLEMQHFHEHLSLGGFKKLQQPGEYVSELGRRFYRSIQIVGVVPLFLAMFAIRRRFDRRSCLSIATLLSAGALSLIIPWMMPHYIATAIPGLLLLCARGIGTLSSIARQRFPEYPFNVGRIGLISLLLVQYAISLGAYAVQPGIPKFAIERNRIAEALADRNVSSIVFVKYLSGHDVNQEWVYNNSDLHSASVVWARSMGKDRDLETAKIYDRRAYELTVGAIGKKQSFELVDYETSSTVRFSKQ